MKELNDGKLGTNDDILGFSTRWIEHCGKGIIVGYVVMFLMNRWGTYWKLSSEGNICYKK